MIDLSPASVLRVTGTEGSMWPLATGGGKIQGFQPVPSREQVENLLYGWNVKSIWYAPVEPVLAEPAREGL